MGITLGGGFTFDSPTTSSSTSEDEDQPSFGDFRQAEASTFSTERHVEAVDESSEQTTDRTNRSGGFFDTIAGGFDFAGGSTDEAVGRSFDKRGGGGVAEGFTSFTGARAWSESQTAQDLRAAKQQAGGDLIQQTDIAVKAGTDFLFDNPTFSAQEGLKQVAKAPTELATGRRVSDEELAQSAQDVAGKYSQFTSSKLRGSLLDNPATDLTVAAGEAFIADPAKAATRLTTGVDIDEGSAEGTVGAIDLFDVGVTVGTAGAGKAGLSAARGLAKSDEAATFASRLLGRGGDETTSLSSRLLGGGDEGATGGASDLFNTGSRAADEAAPGQAAVDEAFAQVDETVPGQAAVDEAVQSVEETAAGADEATGGLRNFIDDTLGRSGDEATQATEEAAAGADEASGGLLDDLLGRATRTSDEAAQAGNEAAGGLEDVFQTSEGGKTFDELLGGSDEAAQAADESGGLLDDLFGGSDEAAKGTDEAARASDELAQGADEASPGRLRRFLGSTTGKATVGTGLVLGGGAIGAGLFGGDLMNAPDKITTASGHTLTHAKDYEPIEKFPQGGRLYAVSKDYKNIGYWLLLGTKGRNLVVLDTNGEPRQAKISTEQFKTLMQQRAGSQGQGGSR